MKKSSNTITAPAPVETARYKAEDRSEEIAIIEITTGAVVALVPFKPKFGPAGRELYRDRQTAKQAAVVAGKILKALNFFE